MPESVSHLGDLPMGFYTVLSEVNQLLATRQWQLHRCHRHGAATLHYFVTDANNQVLTPTYCRQRVGLNLDELLSWLEQSGDSSLVDEARALKNEVHTNGLINSHLI